MRLHAQSPTTNPAPATGNAVEALKPKALKQWWLGLVAEPVFGGVIQPTKDRGEYPSQSHYAPVGGMAFGFDAVYQAGRTAAIETGLQYRLSQVKITYSGLGTGTFDNIHSLEIPLLVNLHTHGPKLRFYTALGFATGVDLTTWFRVRFYPMSFEGCDPAVMTGPRMNAVLTPNLYGALILRAGLEYSINSNTLFKAGVSFNVRHHLIAPYAFSNSYLPYNGEGNQVTFYPYSIGLNLAILFRAKAPRVKPERSSQPAAKKRYQFLVPR